MKFAVPIIWKEQENHVDDCYFCLAQVSWGIIWYKKREVDYPDLISAQRPLPHSDFSPVPISPEQNNESAYKNSKMFVEDKCRPMSNEEKLKLKYLNF